MSGELIDIVNKNNEVIGTTDVDTAHELKQLHRVVGVLIFDQDENLLMQKDSKHGRYDLSVGGHVGSGESYEHAVYREMDEELRLVTPLKLIAVFLSSKARLGHWWALYEGKAPAQWKFRETEEVSCLEKMPLADVVAAMNTKSDEFTPGFINTMREYLKAKNLPLSLAADGLGGEKAG